MALGDTYATLAELKAYLSISDSVDDDKLSVALDTASRAVEGFCDRQFNAATEATPRVYKPEEYLWTTVDDFHTTDGLIIKTDDDFDGVFETTWDAVDYELNPINGIVGGEFGWPFYTIRAVSGRFFPRPGWFYPVAPNGYPTYRRSTVQVTAQWGWSAVPAAVKQSTLILAAETFKMKDAPFGVAGFGDMGVIRVRDNPVVARRLAKYNRNPVTVA